MSVLSYSRPAILREIPLDRHTVIEANAGTGKTYAIQYLVLDLLLNTNSSIEEILVVTFTEKATEELRSRIRTLLENVLSGAASHSQPPNTDRVTIDEAGRRKLETALFGFDRAPICTIHAFCRRILTDLAFDTDAPFGLELIDAHRAFHRAFRAALREVIATGDSTRVLLDEWMIEGETAGYSNLVDSLEDLLRNAHFSRYLQAEDGERSRRAFDQLAEVFDVAMLKKLCGRSNRRASAEALRAADELASIIRRSRGSSDLLRGALGAFDFDVLRYRTAPLADDLDETRLIAALGAARAACSLDVRVVDNFLPLVERRLLEDKREHGEIDYGDMLEWVWNALRNANGASLASLLRKRFRYGLVDEFQDTDDLQWQIFRKIFLESPENNILYVVGDPKQAIYSFRGADVFTYLEASREILKSGGALVKLTDNHRSTGDYIAALNHILDQSAPTPLFSGDIRYDSPVSCGRPDFRASRADGNAILPVTLLRYCPGTSPGSASRMRAEIGRRIAREIRDLLFDPASAIDVRDAGGARRVEAKDIYILTRTGAEAVEIGGYLREQGVPFAFYKKEGLFQTAEAYDVLDVLNAIAEPESQSKRLKAWISPFFAVPYRDLFERTEPTAGHPFYELLYEWTSIAEQERFDILFDQLLHRSGLVSRELFFSAGERELTNYLHIFEILLEQALKESLSLRETISRLESFITGAALPGEIDGNIQRVESDRDAVQIMSVHMSKGLQADVVFLFGGTAQPPMPPRVVAYHDDSGRRRIAVGKAARAAALDSILREAQQDNQRLAYVAITRASAKVYLPLYPDHSTKRPVNGFYEALNNRLQKVSRELDRGEVARDLFEQIDVASTRYAGADGSGKLEERISTWSPPASLMNLLQARTPERFFEGLIAHSRALQTHSYTSIGARTARRYADNIETEEFKYDLDTAAPGLDLRGGRRVGVFLHEVIEKIDLRSFEGISEPTAWREAAAIKTLFADLMRRHQVTDSRWFERGAEIIFNALTSRILISGGRELGPLHKCRSMREMEFTYPVPEPMHPLLQSATAGRWSVERGYLKGFVDFVFEQDGLYYFADWKSDSLAAYDRASLEAQVNDHYRLQAKIYSIGIVRLLGIRSEKEYEQRFGGLLYLFLRGMKRAGDDGVYFQRPSWNELCRDERELINAIPGAAPA
jgi:exodeoxyribonuclease V beta subunit